MGTGSIRLSSEVARPAQAPSSAATARERTGDFAAFANSMAAAAARDNPFAGMGERLNNTAQRVAHGLNQWARRRADEISHETAQKVQAKMSEFSLSLYGRRELAADGVVDAWDAECQKALKEAGSELDPATRKVFEQRMSPWIAGRRENLMRHQFMEVRRGRVNELENDMAATAASETSDILALLGSEQADWSSRLASGTGEEVIAAEKAKAFETHYQQMLAVRADAESRYADAAEQGLYGAEEARARCLKSRHDAAKTIVASAIESGCEDFAEYVLDKLQPKPSQVDPPQAGGSGRGSAPSLPAPAQPRVDRPDSPAPSGVDNAVLSADEVASLRSAVGRARERKAAEARRAEAQRVRDLCDAADKREFEMLKTPMPDDLDGFLSQSEITACEYDELANDESLPLAYRRKYLSTAASIRSSAARAAAAADKAQADEQAAADKARAAAIRQAQEDTFSRVSEDFDAGFTFKPDGSVAELDGVSKMKIADDLLHGEKIDARQWQKLRRSADRQWDDESLAIRSHVLDLASKIAPAAIKYRAAQNDFALAESAKVRSSTPTQVRMTVARPNGRGTTSQNMTYGELIDAMNLALRWRRAKGATVAETNAYFDKLVAGTVRAQLQRTVAENMEYDRKTIKAFEGR